LTGRPALGCLCGTRDTRGIVAFRMKLTKVEAKTKLSQNRDMEDRTRAIAKLEASDGDDAKATAEWMKKVLP
jgi:transcriptional regulator